MSNNNLMITDLEMSKDLDRAAMLSVNGGGIFRDLIRFGRRQVRRTTRYVVRSLRDAWNVLW